MSEEKKPYLIINEECDEIQINIKHTKPYMKLQQENQQLKDVIEDVREDIVFCINGMKNEFACTDSRTNRELHTMVKILEDRLQILDKVKEI